METIKVEFDCQMKTSEDLQRVERSLKQIVQLDNLVLDLEKKSLIFDLHPNTGKGLEEIQKQIEYDTGLLTVLKGFGSTLSAVSQVHSDYSNIKSSNHLVEKSKPVIGVVRLTQLFNNRCFVDAVIDNLNAKEQSPFSVNINEYGDLSGRQFENVGNTKVRLIDGLPAVQNSTRFNRVVDDCDLSDCIGRSIVIQNKSRKSIAGGIVARASPVSGNVKRICACSGKTVWAERKENQATEREFPKSKQLKMKFEINAYTLVNKSNFSDFDDLLEQKWIKAEQNGGLKFKFLESVQKRALDGFYKFHCYLNVNRSTMKRKAQMMDKVKVSINKDEFNFTKINRNEILFDFVVEGIANTIDRQSENRIRATIIVNNAPIEHCSSLLVFELERCLPQIYIKESLIIAMYAASVSKKQSLRLGFNSAGANSSVNHLHWHMYYQDEDLLIARLPIENNKLKNWYLKSLAFELDIKSTNKPDIYMQLSIKIEKLLDYIIDHLKLAYNLFITKCSTNANIVRLFVWPRLPYFGTKDNSKIMPALCEFSGFFTCKEAQSFNQVNEVDLVNMSKQYEIDESLFDEIIRVKNNIFK